MGQAKSRLIRPFRNFNIENRAMKVLERRQRVAEASPKHPTTASKVTQFREENPQFMEQVTTKDNSLHSKLKHMYVDSKDAPIEIKSAVKSLPLDRMAKPETDLGVMDITYPVPDGRAGLKDILYFLGQHQLNPNTVTASSIAQDYKLDEKDARDVLHYFKVLQIHIPKEMYKDNRNMKNIVAQQMTMGHAASHIQLPQNKEKSKVEPDLFPEKT